MDGMVIAEWWMGRWVDRWVEGRKHSFLPTKNFRNPSLDDETLEKTV